MLSIRVAYCKPESLIYNRASANTWPSILGGIMLNSSRIMPNGTPKLTCSSTLCSCGSGVKELSARSRPKSQGEKYILL